MTNKVDLHKIVKEAEHMLEKNPDNAQAFEIYALAKILMFTEGHVKEHHHSNYNNNYHNNNHEMAKSDNEMCNPYAMKDDNY